MEQDGVLFYFDYIIKPEQISTYLNETFRLSFTNHYRSYSNRFE